MRAPDFWFQKFSPVGLLSAPVGFIYGIFSNFRLNRNKGYRTNKPVVCVGNFVTGGAGKTPTALALADCAASVDLNIGYLTRGYGGSLKGPVEVDLKTHTSTDVGDEPLLLAKHATTIVSRNRALGAKMLDDMPAVDIIVMDDGFQSPNIVKDLCLLVVDAARGIGNGFVFPAGPLRASLSKQLSQMDMLIVAGKGEAASDLIRQNARQGKASVRLNIEPKITKKLTKELKKAGVVAFSGIGNAGKFHNTLEDLDISVKKSFDFGDHHTYSEANAQDVLFAAKEQNLRIVTTEKDWVRLASQSGDYVEQLRAATDVIPIVSSFDYDAVVREELLQLVRGI